MAQTGTGGMVVQLSNTLTNFWHGLVRGSQMRGVAATFSVGIVIVAVFLGAYTFMALTGTLVAQPERSELGVLLVVNLAVFTVLLGLVIWRFVKIYLATRSGNAGAKLHGRMVTLFTVIAGGPAIIVAIYASIVLEGGLEKVFGHQVQLLVNNTNKVAGAYLNEHRMVLNNDLQLMKSDLNGQSALYANNPEKFKKFVEAQVGVRSLNDAYIINRKGAILSRSSANLMPSQRMPSEAVMAKVAAGETAALYTDIESNQVKALVKLDAFPDAYLFISRFVDPRVLSHVQNANEITQRFKVLRDQRSQAQLTFMVMYIVLALVVVFAAIWIGLWVANRIVTPIGNLMDAAEKVSVGDLTARVRVDRAGEDDEIDLLSRAFNRMTKQLESQRSDLVEANEQIDDRRRFTEAVLAGVSAGVIGLDRTGRIDHTNRASLKFLGRDAETTNGELITDIIPEMSGVVYDAMEHPLNRGQAQVALHVDGSERTLNVRVTGKHSQEGNQGYVLTFDDITELVSAQRNAAWADVAQRIAHEIKNPLTPIQLSAERLNRKYRKEISSDPAVFAQCTETIIRQVGDIGRMVDEFSSFARMPTAAIKDTDVIEILRQAVFLQRVAHPEIEYAIHLPDSLPPVQCDSHLLSQALTNILKNAAEAVRGHEAEEAEGTHSNHEPAKKIGRIEVVLRDHDDTFEICVTDSGCGLPETGRLRLTEPYMTTRTKGTGLGLAIVQKIMEDHHGRLELHDAPKEDGWETGASIKLVFPHKIAETTTGTGTQNASNAQIGDVFGEQLKGKEAAHGV
mgnify:CR=1 FL=1